MYEIDNKYSWCSLLATLILNMFTSESETDIYTNVVFTCTCVCV